MNHHTPIHRVLLLLYVATVGLGCSGTKAISGPNPRHVVRESVSGDTNEERKHPLTRVGQGVSTLKLSGKLSLNGALSFSGLPFSALVVEKDSFRITMNGPLGITAARLFTTPTSFTLVNYFEQTVLDGNPNSLELAKQLPFPVSVPELASLIRGEVPGDCRRFSEHSVREDGSVLYRSADELGVEFALVDTVQHVLRQYQRKSTTGAMLLNVTFDDIQEHGSARLAHSVDVVVDDRRQSMQFRLEQVDVNQPITERMMFDVPSSFRRTTYR